MGCHFLLQAIVPAQGSNLGLLYWQVNSLPLSYVGSSMSLLVGLKSCRHPTWVCAMALPLLLPLLSSLGPSVHLNPSSQGATHIWPVPKVLCDSSSSPGPFLHNFRGFGASGSNVKDLENPSPLFYRNECPGRSNLIKGSNDTSLTYVSNLGVTWTPPSDQLQPIAMVCYLQVLNSSPVHPPWAP